jgi:hypothetical protein
MLPDMSATYWKILGHIEAERVIILTVTLSFPSLITGNCWVNILTHVMIALSKSLKFIIHNELCTLESVFTGLRKTSSYCATDRLIDNLTRYLRS